MKNKPNKPFRVLMIIPALNVCGGMESFVMNYFRNIDRNVVVFDFVTHEISENSYIREIEDLGGKIYLLPHFSLSNIFVIKKSFYKILQSNKYDIIHCNMANAAFIYMKIAKKLNVSVRILHSHQDKYADSLLHSIRNIPLVYVGKKYVNLRLACSKQAGEFLFKNNQYYVINNAIDYKKYSFNAQIRKQVRYDLKLDDKYIIGNTGRLCVQKNQSFLIDILKCMIEIRPNAHLLLIGEGNEEASLRKKINDLKLSEYVTFLGSRNDINKLLQGVDVFVFPSLYEGLGISLLEAQAASLLTVCSDRVPVDANISGNLKYLSLELSAREWATKIVQFDNEIKERSNNIDLCNSYNIENQCDKLMNLYISSIEEIR